MESVKLICVPCGQAKLNAHASPRSPASQGAARIVDFIRQSLGVAC